MAKIAAEGVALKSQLFIGTKHGSAELTATTFKTFIDTTTTATSEEVSSPNDLTGIGASSNFVTQGQLGKDVASQFRAQPTPPTLTFSMVANPSDLGQALILSAGTTEVGFGIVIKGADGGLRYKAYNGFVDTVENISPEGTYSIDVSIAVNGAIQTIDD